MKKIFYLFVVNLLINSSVEAQSFRKYSNEFLKIGVGGRQLSMGTSLAASEGDATSVFYNPSAITTLPTATIAAMHNSYFAGIANFDYIGVVLPYKESQRIGVSFIRFGVDNIPNTLGLYNPDGSINYDNIKSFSIADMALFLTYAKEIQAVSGLSIGSNVKIINRRYGSFANAWGFGLDVGAQIVREKYKIGLFAQDISTTFSLWSFSFTDAEKQTLANTNNEIPSSSSELTAPSFHLGGQYNFAINKGNIGIAPTGKLSVYTDQRNVLVSAPISFDISMGMEFEFWKLVMLRMGVNNFTKATNDIGEEYISFVPSLGVGFKFNQFEIDYSYNNVANSGIGLYSHVFSLAYKFKAKPVVDTRPSMPMATPIENTPSFDPNNPLNNQGNN